MIIRKLLLISLLLVGALQASTTSTEATIKMEQNTFSNQEEILVTFKGLKGQSNEWMAIYPAGSSNDFGNIVQWKLTGGTKNGTVTFEAQKVGNYDLRVFQAANFITHKEFSVNDGVLGASVTTPKQTYSTTEKIEVLFENMSGDDEDWIGIYPVGSNNDWKNIVKWNWTGGEKDGMKSFDALPKGLYDVRVFFNNSFNTEASTQILVEKEQVPVEPDVTVDTTKEVYSTDEKIIAMYSNMSADDEDWIAIYPAGSSNDWENMIQWQWTNGNKAGVSNFGTLPAGEYEVRVFFNNTFDTEAKFAFSVVEREVTRILYDDFEDGIDPRWTLYFGKEMTLLDVGAVDQKVEHTERQVEVEGQHSLRTYNSDGLEQSSGYIFNFENPDKKFKFLEVDMRIGESSHRFAFGVKIKTKFGDRKIEFASWLNHTLLSGEQIVNGPYGNVLEGHRQAFTYDGQLHVHPAPSDYFVGTGGLGIIYPELEGIDTDKFIHYKIDIAEALKVLEPENEFEGMRWFTTSGGDYDNLALSSK
jgi:hypothetical protein